MKNSRLVERVQARVCRRLKESKKQIPRGLKPARKDKNQPLIGTTEVVPCYKALQSYLSG